MNEQARTGLVTPLRALFVLLLLGALAAIVFQWNSLSKLRQENQALRREHDEAQRLSRENEAAQSLENQTQEIERLRADNQELLKLRSEVARLRQQVKEMEKLRAENHRLQEEYKNKMAQLAQQAQAAAAAAPPSPSPSSERVESIACINNLKQIGLAGRLWANDYNDVLPPDFLTMHKELGTPRILVCPSDKTKPRPVSADWANFDPNNITYQMVSPGASVSEPKRAFVQCAAHGHVCYVDGSVVAGAAKSP